MAEQYSDDEVEKRLRDEADKKGVAYDPSDLQDVRHRDNSQEGLDAAFKKYDSRANNDPNSGQDNNDGRSNPWEGGGGSKNETVNAWGASGATASGNSANGGANDILAQMRAEMLAREKADSTRRDDLYHTLEGRAGQALNVDPNDPVMKAQTDAFRAEQTRGSRNYLADIAEKAGPDANLRGESRMAAEKVGQSTSGFQAQLMGNELTARRQEIADSLNSMRCILTADQQAQLQQELAVLDNAIKSRGLDVQAQLGNRGLDVDWKKALLSREAQDNMLGFNYWDRANFYDNQNLG